MTQTIVRIAATAAFILGGTAGIWQALFQPPNATEQLELFESQDVMTGGAVGPPIGRTGIKAGVDGDATSHLTLREGAAPAADVNAIGNAHDGAAVADAHTLVTSTAHLQAAAEGSASMETRSLVNQAGSSAHVSAQFTNDAGESSGATVVGGAMHGELRSR